MSLKLDIPADDLATGIKLVCVAMDTRDEHTMCLAEACIAMLDRINILEKEIEQLKGKS